MIQSVMPENEIKSELSYAYVHAVASRVGCACQPANRSLDNLGVDAHIRFEGDFPSIQNALNCVALDIQIKSTSQNTILDSKGRGIIFDGLPQSVYDKYRDEKRTVPAFLVLLVLPHESEEWLHLSEEELILKKCAYWVSLKGASECFGDTKRIFFPKNQLFNVEQLENIIATLATEGEFCYVA